MKLLRVLILFLALLGFILLPLLLGGCEGMRIEGQLEYAGKSLTVGQGADGKTVLGLRANLGNGKAVR